MKHPGLGSYRLVILCRYYHTPGLTCTSRPCRFVHSLDAFALSSSVDTSRYQMLSPTNMPDPTVGTFAQAQMTAQAEFYGLADIDPAVVPGNPVIITDDKGEGVVGTVFLMSGGGKGLAGKSAAKFKSKQSP